MSSRTRSIRRNIAHVLMKRTGIQHPNKLSGGRNISKKHPEKSFQPVSHRSYFAANWRDTFRNMVLTRQKKVRKKK